MREDEDNEHEDIGIERYCELRMMLHTYSGVETAYDAKSGIKRSLRMSGRIDDPYQDQMGYLREGQPDSAFHDKLVRLVIYSLPDPERLGWMKEIRDTPSISHACGVVGVRAGVEPEKFEYDGKNLEIEPVTVALVVGADAFEAICRQMSVVENHRRILQMQVTLIGDSLPKTDHEPLFGPPLHLRDLDVSKPQEYWVRSFEISYTRYFDDLRDRVLQVERSREEGYGTDISILLTEVRYEVSMARALVRSISCEGRVIHGRGKPYDGADVTVNFYEHRTNKYGELPEMAFFGEFGYWLKQPDEEHSMTSFKFDLRYIPKDAHDFLIPLLSHEVGKQVVLTVNITNEKEQLLTVTDKLEGNVRDYRFLVLQNLINGNP